MFPSSLTHSSFLPPLQRVSPRLCRATFPSSPTCSSPPVSESSFVTCHVPKLNNPLLPLLPSIWRVLIYDMPCFEAHQPAPPSSSPPVSESLFVICYVFKLTNPLLPLPPPRQYVLFSA